MIYPLIKLAVPTAIVGVGNLITYFSFYAYSNSQINNRNWRAKQHFLAVKNSVFDEIINDNELLMRDRHGAIVEYFKNSNQKSILNALGGQQLVDKWNSIVKQENGVVLENEMKKVDFFHEVRLFCLLNKSSEDRKILSEVSQLCSRRVVKESDFDLPKDE